MVEVTKAKNADYTGGSGDPFANFKQVGNFIQVEGVTEIGFFTRMSDKFSRIGSFITKGVLMVKDESVEDTLIDLANYCILFAGYLRSKRILLNDGRPTPMPPVFGTGSGGTSGGRGSGPIASEERYK